MERGEERVRADMQRLRAHSEPVHAPTSAHHRRKNLTFTGEQLQEMERENQRLLTSMVHIHVGGDGGRAMPATVTS
jgi:hypothetical protein